MAELYEQVADALYVVVGLREFFLCDVPQITYEEDLIVQFFERTCSDAEEVVTVLVGFLAVALCDVHGDAV